jgi:hypothetical protein
LSSSWSWSWSSSSCLLVSSADDLLLLFDPKDVALACAWRRGHIDNAYHANGMWTGERPTTRTHSIYIKTKKILFIILLLASITLRNSLRRSCHRMFPSPYSLSTSTSDSMATASNSKQTSLRDRKIVLSDEENQIFDIVIRSLESKRLTTVPRVAGGWVRDKVTYPSFIARQDNLASLRYYYCRSSCCREIVAILILP